MVHTGVIPLMADVLSSQHLLRSALCLWMVVLVGACWWESVGVYMKMEYIGEKWESVDRLELKGVSSISRSMKLYLSQPNPSIPIDTISRVEVRGNDDSLLLDVGVTSLYPYEQIVDGRLKYYIGDVHILSSSHYLISVYKPPSPSHYANLSIEVEIMHPSASLASWLLTTILMLAVFRLLCVHPQLSRLLGLLVVMTSNPLLIIHLLMPSIYTSVINAVMASSFILYLSLFFHYLCPPTPYWKHALVLILFLLNVLRVTHYRLDNLEIVLFGWILLLVVKALWNKLLNTKQIQHRFVVFVTTTILFISLMSVISYLGNRCMNITHHVVQLYGLSLLLLLTRNPTQKTMTKEIVVEVESERRRMFDK